MNGGGKKEIAQPYRLGLRGEDLAVSYLEGKGYTVLERRKRIGGIEIDIVVSIGGLIVFVEVKTRASDRLAAPEQAVDQKKQRRMIAAADMYVRERNLSCEVRFDIVSIVANPMGEDIRHIEGAFLPFA